MSDDLTALDPSGVSGMDRTGALMVHLFSFFFFLPAFFIGFLIVRHIQKNGLEGSFVAENTLEAVNFQITVAIALLVSLLVGGGVGVSPMLIFCVIVICDFALVILAAITVSFGKTFRYPLSLRLLKGKKGRKLVKVIQNNE